jgi:hypothetical protein
MSVSLAANKGQLSFTELQSECLYFNCSDEKNGEIRRTLKGQCHEKDFVFKGLNTFKISK